MILMQCDNGPPSTWCAECGKVGLGTSECDHSFEPDIVACDYSGIWQRKQVEGLYRGRVSLIVNQLPNRDWRDLVDLHWFDTPSRLVSILERAKVSRPRTVATHNYGNKTPLHVLAAFPDAILVVHDLHHLGLADRPGAGAERTLIGRARRIVFPSAPMRDAVAGYLARGTKTLVQHQRVPAKHYLWRDRCEGAIYQGRVNDSWGGVFELLREDGHRVRVMPSIVNHGGDLSRFGDVEPTRYYSKVLDACSRAKWGLAGSPSSNPSMARSMSNKYWDYLAAGCVPIVLNHPGVAEVVRATGCGVVARNAEDVVKIAGDDGLWAEARGRIRDARGSLAMESQREEWEAFL